MTGNLFLIVCARQNASVHCQQFLTVLGMSREEQMDPRELFQVLVSDHLPHWQLMFSLGMQQHGTYTS